MKTPIKLLACVTFIVVAVMAATEPGPERGLEGQDRSDSCYSEAQVDLLMRSNDWTKQEATTILDLACQYSRKK